MDALRSLYVPDVPWWSLVIRAIVAYSFVLLLLRIAGKRQVGQMGMAEFVALLLISNAVQNSMNGGDNSLVGGLILAIILLVMAHLVAWLTYRSRLASRILQGHATRLIHCGKLEHEKLARELLTVRELKHLLRKQGIHDLTDIAEAVLEPDGFISVTKISEINDADEQFPRNDVY